IIRLPCSAHTLQLTINFALALVKPHICCIRKLVKFFSSPKQSQRLYHTQYELAQHIKTCWNSSYLAWKCLLILKPAIEWLNGTISLLNEPDARKDAQDKLVNILEPFDQLTTYLSRMQYTMLSVVNLSIEALKYQYAREMTLSVDELNQMWNNQEELRSNNESNSSHSENEESSESESNDEHFASSHKHNTQ
ncbi:45893_t:CDS:2, partial [Gigaspora margarita]